MRPGKEISLHFCHDANPLLCFSSSPLPFWAWERGTNNYVVLINEFSRIIVDFLCLVAAKGYKLQIINGGNPGIILISAIHEHTNKELENLKIPSNTVKTITTCI